MALVERLKKWRGLARLKSKARRDPSPASYGELAERFIALGETDAALRVAEQGLQLFPDSERLAAVRTYAKKGRLTVQLRRLREDAARRPNPLTFAQLAEIYRDLGSLDDALAITAECAERFPLNESPYLVQGEIRLQRFLHDVIAKDAIIAENALRKVVRLNAHNVKAHLLLAEIYWLVGMPSACRRHLRSVLTIMPTARDVQDFLKETDTTAETAGDEGEFEDLAQQTQERGTFANPAELFPDPQTKGASSQGKPRTHVDLDGLREKVLALGANQGMRNAVVLGKDGEILADFTDADSLSRNQFAELVSAIESTAGDASRRMDTGALVRVEIEGPAGSVTVARARSLTVGILYVDPLRHERVWELLQDFVARNLAAQREESHA